VPNEEEGENWAAGYPIHGTKVDDFGMVESKHEYSGINL
jgi:hypothetical protein